MNRLGKGLQLNDPGGLTYYKQKKPPFSVWMAVQKKASGFSIPGYQLTKGKFI